MAFQRKRKRRESSREKERKKNLIPSPHEEKHPSHRTEKEKRLATQFKFMVYLYAQGKTNQEVADLLGVSVSRVWELSSSYPDLWRSVEETKSMLDQAVEATLFRRAVGYTYEEEKHEDIVTKEGLPTGEIKSTKYKKHEPPNISAIKFWLQCRSPDRWKNDLEIVFDLKALEDGELHKLAKDSGVYDALYTVLSEEEENKDA